MPGNEDLYNLFGLGEKVQKQTQSLKVVKPNDVTASTKQAIDQTVESTSLQNFITEQKSKLQIDLNEATTQAQADLYAMQSKTLDFVDTVYNDLGQANTQIDNLQKKRVKEIIDSQERINEIDKDKSKSPFHYIWGSIRQSFIQDDLATDIKAVNNYANIKQQNRARAAERVSDYRNTTYMRAASELKQLSAVKAAHFQQKAIALQSLDTQTRTTLAGALTVDKLTKELNNATADRFKKDPADLQNPIFKFIHAVAGNPNQLSFSDVEAYKGWAGSLDQTQRNALTRMAVDFNTGEAAGSKFSKADLIQGIKDSGDLNQLDVYLQLSNDKETGRLVTDGQQAFIRKNRLASLNEYKRQLAAQGQLSATGQLTDDQQKAAEKFIQSDLSSRAATATPGDFINFAADDYTKQASRLVPQDGSDFTVGAIMSDPSYFEALKTEGFDVDTIVQTLQSEDLKIALEGSTSTRTGLVNKQLEIRKALINSGMSMRRASEAVAEIAKHFYTGKALQEIPQLVVLSEWGEDPTPQVTMDVSGQFFFDESGEELSQLQTFSPFDPLDIESFAARKAKTTDLLSGEGLLYQTTRTLQESNPITTVKKLISGEYFNN